jgi:hypothetical protein
VEKLVTHFAVGMLWFIIAIFSYFKLNDRDAYLTNLIIANIWIATI